MTPYLLRTVARQAATIRRLRADNAQLARGYRRANDGWRTALDGQEEAIRHAKGWQRRAEALYALADPDLRDGVMGCLSWIEDLPEVKETR